MSLVNSNDREISSVNAVEKCFFSSPDNSISHQTLVKALVIFIAHNKFYSRQVIIESVPSFLFIYHCGVKKWWLPLLNNPLDIVDPYIEMDKIILGKKAETGTMPKLANDLRIESEYTWLFNRIIQDIAEGDTIYFSKLVTIPDLLFYLLANIEFYKISPQKLVLFFSIIGHKLILQTLPLFDEHDKAEAHCNLKIKGDIYLVNKQFSRQIYQQFAALLLSDEFLTLRQSWIQNKDSLQLFVSFPFLLKGLDYKTVQSFVNDNKVAILMSAENCLKNRVNPYVNCPYLLAYLDAEEIIDLYNTKPDDHKKPHNDIKALFVEHAVPAEVIIHYIKTNTIEALATSIPELENVFELIFSTVLIKNY